MPSFSFSFYVLMKGEIDFMEISQNVPSIGQARLIPI
jgi:hypothetical protein